jgi:hypothetical protein
MKYTETFVTKDAKADTVARLIVDEIVSRYGAPSEIRSDQGVQFTKN